MEVRKCPGGSFGPEPFRAAFAGSETNWNCWIGCVFGTYASPPNAPFYYHQDANLGKAVPPMKASRIKTAAAAMLFTDTTDYLVYSPLLYPFVDGDGDKIGDPLTGMPFGPFDHGRPTVHGNGCNTALFDGHVEHVTYKNLWAVDVRGNAAHPFWYLDGSH